MDGCLQGGRVSFLSFPHCMLALFELRTRNVTDQLRLSIPTRFRYEIALLYLKQADYDLDIAVEAYLADETWEKEHPIAANMNAKGKKIAPRRKYGFSNSSTG